MTDVYHLRRVQPRHQKKVAAFLSSLFKTKPGFWKWKLSIPYKRPASAWIATLPSGEPVSHYAYMPLAVVAGKERVHGALCTAMATAPRHRGRSLISQLSRAAFDDVERQGAEICLGFSNQAGLKVDKKATGYGYRVVGSFATYAAIPRKTMKSDVVLIRMKRSERFRSWPATPHALALQKSADYLEWRYRAHPDHTNECFRLVRGNKQIGYAVLRSKNARMEITDLIVGNDREIPDAVRSCSAYARQKGSRILTITVLKNTFWKRVLKQAGFVSLLKRTRYSLTIKTTRHTPQDLKRLFLKANSWRLVGGDIL